MVHLEESNAHITIDTIEGVNGTTTTTFIVRKKDGTLLASLMILPRNTTCNIQGVWEVMKP